MKSLVFSVSILSLTVAACSTECRGSLGDVGANCPATFDGTLDQLSCGPPGETQMTFACGDLVGFSAGSYGGLECVYDASSRRLVGARIWGDTGGFCGNSDSFQRTAGRLPDSACQQLPAVSMRTCPVDAGAD